MQAIQRAERGELSVTNPVAAMIQQAVDKGLNPTELYDLYERMDAKMAERAFAAAMVRLQSEIPKIPAIRAIEVNGRVRSKFAHYGDIMGYLRGPLAENGFSIMDDTEVSPDGKRTTAILTIMHSAGHSKTTRYSVLNAGGAGMVGPQADGAAGSYARRYALCHALNIVVDADTDARSRGGAADPAAVAALRERLAAVGGDEASFLKIAGVSEWEALDEKGVAVLDYAMGTKEAAKRRKETPVTVTPTGKVPPRPKPIKDDEGNVTNETQMLEWDEQHNPDSVLTKRPK